MTRAREWRYVILLAILVGVAIAQPLAPDSGAGSLLQDLFVTLLIVAVLRVVFVSRFGRRAALAAGVVSIGCRLVRHVLPGYGGVALGVVHDATLAAFFAFAVVEILRGIFRNPTVGADDIVGSACGFLLAGAAWASLYSLVDYLLPGSFAMSASAAAQLAGWHARHGLFDYLSFLALTTMGYADVTPARAPAVTLGWLEAVFGLFYMAVVVAQLVASYLARRLAPGGTPDSG